MKIVVVGTRGFPYVQGGIETHCEHLYPRLVARGCEVTVLTRRQYVDPALRQFRGVHMLPLSCPRSKYLETFYHTLKGIFTAARVKPDLLHVHAIGPSLFVPVANKLGLRVVVTNHGPDYDRSKWNWFAKGVLHAGEAAASKWADQLICVSDSIAEDMREKYHRECAVIPNGVDIPELETGDEALQSYGLQKGKYILAVSRFVPEKGLHDLIAAFLQTGKQHDWKLAIVGKADHEDDYSRDLKSTAARYKNIVMTGYLSGKFLGQIYSHAGLFVLPSYHEGLPIVLLEAMSYGLSCIATHIPANRNVPLDDDRYFVPRETGQLAEKLMLFMRRPMSGHDRQRQRLIIADRYNWDTIADETLAVYRRAMYGQLVPAPVTRMTG